MNIFGVMDVSASALKAERVRAEVVASNMANAETTRTPEGGPYQRHHVVFEAEGDGSFEQSLTNQMNGDLSGGFRSRLTNSFTGGLYAMSALAVGAAALALVARNKQQRTIAENEI